MNLSSRNPFAGDERGALTPLILTLFVGILLMTGFALDLARQESERADLQDALDRGVLAATSLTQTVDAETTIREYLDNRSFSDNGLSVSVATDQGLNHRTIAAGAEYSMDTIFLRMAGLAELKVPARAMAMQSIQDTEISLVIDISGSMARERSAGTTQSRLQVLRGAASGFIDTMLTDISRPTTTISLVPYAGQVNAGPLFNHFNTSRVHNYSSCTEFLDSDFNTTSLPAANSRAQVPHFQWFRFEGNYGHEAEWGWCPNDSRPIIPFSNDPVVLKAAIAGLIAHDGTGTQNGLKWGLGLLDPSSRPLTESLVAAGTVAPAFAVRPAAFNDPGILKVVVLMTDGNIRYQQRPRASAYNSQSERTYWAGHGLTSGSATLSRSRSRTIDEAHRVDLFLNLCSLAKQNGVIVFTIGFDVTAGSGAFNDMRSCASSVGHFYHVEGLDLIDAFDQIAATISQLKLVE